MDSYIYVHHKGHFNHPDSRSKVSLKTRQRNFLEVFYDVTNSLPKENSFSLSLQMTSHDEIGNDNTCKEYVKYHHLPVLNNLRWKLLEIQCCEDERKQCLHGVLHV